jgi:uroporphyrinogen III methyltransferase/synthase
MDTPFNNVKVVVTRAKRQAGEFAGLLEGAGAKVVYFPTIEFKEPDDLSVVDNAIQKLGADKSAYDWIIFTSANGVDSFFDRLRFHSKDVSTISAIKVGVVGPKTAYTLKKMGIKIDIVPEDYRAEGLIKSLLEKGVSGKKILIPRALIGREILPDTLRENGAEVTVAPVYETVTPCNADAEGLLRILDKKSSIIISFTSGSTVKNFFALFDDKQIKNLKSRVKIAVLSPVTAEVVKKFGFNVDIMPDMYTAKDLAVSIIQALRSA